MEIGVLGDGVVAGTLKIALQSHGIASSLLAQSWLVGSKNLGEFRERLVKNPLTHLLYAPEDGRGEALLREARNMLALIQSLATPPIPVLLSSSRVFRGKTDGGYYIETEEADAPPWDDPYDWALREAERAFQRAKLPNYIVRTSSRFLFGLWRDDCLVDLWRRLRDYAGSNVPLVLNNCYFHKPTYLPDFAEALTALLSGDYLPGVYHLVNEESTEVRGGRGVSEIEVAAFIGSLKRIRPLKLVGSSPRDDGGRWRRAWLLSNTKGPRLRPWQETVREWFRQHERMRRVEVFRL